MWLLRKGKEQNTHHNSTTRCVDIDIAMHALCVAWCALVSFSIDFKIYSHDAHVDLCILRIREKATRTKVISFMIEYKWYKLAHQWITRFECMEGTKDRTNRRKVRNSYERDCKNECMIDSNYQLIIRRWKWDKCC